MKLKREWSVFGKGKTGSKVIELLEKEIPTVTSILDSKNIPSQTNIKPKQGIIAFVPSEVLLNHVDLFIEKKINLISGATGLTWPKEISDEVASKGLTWISGSNFSLGMRLIHQMINSIKGGVNLFPSAKINIHEIHHTKKLDGPSGTALSWKEWLGDDKNIHVTYERIGDVVGDHQLTIDAPTETITLRHEAKNRTIFAEGAIWAAKYLDNNNLTSGIHYFENITNQYFNQGR